MIIGDLLLAIFLALTIIFIGQFAFIGSDNELRIDTIIPYGIFTQVSQLVAVIFVCRYGFGPIRNLGFKFKTSDIYIGFFVALFAIIANTAVVAFLSAVGIDASNASNAGIITDAKETFWIGPAIFLAVIGAPIVEEVVFRGLFQKSFAAISNIYVGIVISAGIFALLHIPDEYTVSADVVLKSSIFIVGIAFGWAAAKYKRLGPAIMGHFYFNLLGVIVALA